jgi:hypothetical protein
MGSKQEALELLRNHTQYYVPNSDLGALKIAMAALEKEIEIENDAK